LGRNICCSSHTEAAQGYLSQKGGDAMNLGFSCPGKKGNTVYGTAALLRKMTVDLDTAKKVQEVMDNETKETKTSNKVQ
jgi:hypothetical protein